MESQVPTISDLDRSDEVYNKLECASTDRGDSDAEYHAMESLDSPKEASLKPKLVLGIEVLSLASFVAFGVVQDIVFERMPPFTVLGMRIALLMMTASAMKLRFSLATFDVKDSLLSTDAANIGILSAGQAILNFAPMLIELAQNEIQSADTLDVTLGCFELVSLIILTSFVCNGMRDFRNKVEPDVGCNCESTQKIVLDYLYGLVDIAKSSVRWMGKIWCNNSESLLTPRPRLPTLSISANLREHIVANSASCYTFSFLFGVFVVAYDSVEYKAYWLPYVVTLTISQTFVMYYAYTLQTLVNKSNPDENSAYRGQVSSAITLTMQLLATVILLYKTVWSYLNHH